MKRFLTLLGVLSMVLGFSMQSHADLNLIGYGTSAYGTHNLIYDSDLDVTWYDFTNAQNTWQDQVDWAANLDIGFGGEHFTDWRLPTTSNDPICSGNNCTNSEMGHLYYTELGNSAGGPLTKTDDFQNLESDFHWSGTTYTGSSAYAWYFNFEGSNQGITLKNTYRSALAVHPGEIAVAPEPISSILFLAGGATMGFMRFRKRARL